MTKITGYTALVTALTDCVVPVVDVHDTTMAPTGTTKKITLANLQEAIDNDIDTNIQPSGAQASGAVGSNSDCGHVHPATGWVPADNNLLAANGPLPAVGSGQLTIAQTLYIMKIWIRQPFTATNLWLQCSTLGAGTSTQSFAGIWSSTGTLLTSSSDIGSAFVSPATTGPVSVPWTTPASLTVAMGFVWVGFVFHLSSTQPTIRTQSVAASAVQNTNLAASVAAAATNGTSVTSLASITPSANNVTGTAFAYWAGIS